MATQTTHYNLIKPSSADRVAVGDLNDNADTIDGYLYIANERADQIADDYNTSSTYNIGDYCRRENYIYKCNSNSVTGNWDSTKWDRVKVMESIVDVNERIDAKSNTFSASGESFSLTPTSEGSVLAHTLYGMSVQNGTPTPSSPVDIKSSVANFTCTNSDSTESITITTDLTLRAIEVTSSDDYNLVRDGKYYIADTVDWSEDDGYVLTKRIEHLSLTDNFQNYTAPSSGQGYVERYFANPIVNSSVLGSNAYNSRTPLAICNCAENGVVSASSSGKFFILLPGKTNQRLRIDVPDSVTDTTTAATWATSNGLYIDFILATPTTEHLTAKQAEALLSLKTYDTATSIVCTADVAPTMAIEYAKERVPALALTGHNESELKVDWASENVLGAKNLLPYPYYSGATTINNVVITDNGDGTLTFNGTASSAGTYRLTHYNIAHSTETLSKIPNGNYIATGGSTSANLRVGYNNNGTIAPYATDTGKGANFSINHNSTDYTGVYFELWFASGTVFNNFVVKPMIRLVSVKDTTYAPYAMTNKDLTDVVKFNQTTAGTYTLQATVASNGTVTYEWVSTT